MNNIKNISPVTEHKSGSVEVKASSRKTPNKTGQTKKDNAVAVVGGALVIWGPHPLIKIAGATLIFAAGCAAQTTQPNPPAPVPTPVPSPTATPQPEFDDFSDLPVESSILTPDATGASASAQPYSLWHVYNYGIPGWEKNNFLRININSKSGELYVSKIEKDAADTEISETTLVHDYSQDKLQADAPSDNLFIRDGYKPYSFKNSDGDVVEIVVDTKGKLYSSVLKKADNFHKGTTIAYKASQIQDLKNLKEVQSISSKRANNKTYKIQENAKEQLFVIIKEGKSKKGDYRLFIAVNPDSATVFTGIKDGKSTITALYKYSK